jgi:hypothetical protein
MGNQDWSQAWSQDPGLEKSWIPGTDLGPDQIESLKFIAIDSIFSINRCVLNIQVVFLNITYFFRTSPGTLQGILKDLPILPHIFTRTQKCKKFIHTSVGLKFIHTSVDGRRSTFKGSLIHGCDAYTAGISGYSARIEAAVYHSLS